MSHQMRPNPVTLDPLGTHKVFSLQKVVRDCGGYSGWQMSHFLRPNTLSTL